MDNTAKMDMLIASVRDQVNQALPRVQQLIEEHSPEAVIGAMSMGFENYDKEGISLRGLTAYLMVRLAQAEKPAPDDH